MSLWDLPALRLWTCFNLPEQHLQALNWLALHSKTAHLLTLSLTCPLCRRQQWSCTGSAPDEPDELVQQD